MTGSYPEYDEPRIDAGRLWAGGFATAVVAGLVAEVGILIARGMLHLAVFAPQADGMWGNADTTGYAVAAALAALLATGLLHLLLMTTPRGTLFFGWIMALLIVVAVLVPLRVLGTHREMIATVSLDFLIGLVITTLLIGSADGARARVRERYRRQAYGIRES